jgi:hypothetical protein
MANFDFSAASSSPPYGLEFNGVVLIGGGG